MKKSPLINRNPLKTAPICLFQYTNDSLYRYVKNPMTLYQVRYQKIWETLIQSLKLTWVLKELFIFLLYISMLQRLFLRANTESLQALRAGDTLIDLCLNLPTIKKAKAKVEEALAGRPYSIPSNHAEALMHRNRWVMILCFQNVFYFFIF